MAADTLGAPAPASRPGGEAASPSVDKVRVVVVPIDTVMKQLGPLCSLPEPALLELVKKYTDEGVGGLREEQWLRFCTENRGIFSSLGEEMLDFDKSGEYTLIIVEHGVDPGGQSTRSFTQQIVRFVESFAAGGIAGAVSKTVIAPGDRVKIIFQVESKRHFSLREAFRLGVLTVKEFGVTGLWIGNGATMLRVVPYAAITYASFDAYHAAFTRAIGKSNSDGSIDERRAVTIRFLSGALAGATSTTCTYPLDLMRARFAARSSSGKRRFPSYRAAFKDATAKNGIASLYSGLIPTVVGIMPYAGCSFACFETMKFYIVRHYNLRSEKEIPTWQRLVAGGLSGLIAQSATYPLDIVRRRMQVTPGRYRGVGDALVTVLREEGLRQGLYKGLAMNWIKGPIATATSFTINDLIKRRTKQYHDTTVVRSSRPNAVPLPEAFLCGGVAAATAKFWTIPFDRLKIMYQVGMEDAELNRRGFRYVLDLVKSNPNMWASGHVTMVRVVPYGAITYCLFDVFKGMAERLLYTHTATPVTNFIAGAAAAAVGTAIVYPLDLLRTRVAANQMPKFQSYFWLLRAIARRHGVAALWKGCYLSMMGVSVLAGIGFASYEYLKQRFNCQSFSQYLAAGMASGLAGQALTYPLSVMKRNRQAEGAVFSRLVEQQTSPHSIPTKRLLSSLYRKMPFSFTLSSLTFGISFAVNDACRDIFASARKDMFQGLFFSRHSSSSS